LLKPIFYQSIDSWNSIQDLVVEDQGYCQLRKHLNKD